MFKCVYVSVGVYGYVMNRVYLPTLGLRQQQCIRWVQTLLASASCVIIHQVTPCSWLCGFFSSFLFHSASYPASDN